MKQPDRLIGWINKSGTLNGIYWVATTLDGRDVVEIFKRKNCYRWHYRTLQQLITEPGSTYVIEHFGITGPGTASGKSTTLKLAKETAAKFLTRRGIKLIDPKMLVMK